jgi:adenosylcobinamide amidohydrolase
MRKPFLERYLRLNINNRINCKASMQSGFSLVRTFYNIEVTSWPNDYVRHYLKRTAIRKDRPENDAPLKLLRTASELVTLHIAKAIITTMNKKRSYAN